MAATVDFMVPRIDPIAPLLLLVDHFGPTFDTITPTVGAKGIEKMTTVKVKPYSWAGDGSVDTQVNLANSPFKNTL